MPKRNSKCNRAIIKALKECGKSYEIVQGNRGHRKIFIDGLMIAVVSNWDNDNDAVNVLAAIRKAVSK